MNYNRTGDAVFTLVVAMVSSYFLIRWGSAGLSLAVWLILLPLYIFRIIVWSNWDFWRRKIYYHGTPRLWMGTVFILWTFSAYLLFQMREMFTVTALTFHPLLSTIGFFAALAGLLVTIWTLWLLGLERAVLTTLIFGEKTPSQKNIIRHGPYALTPHPMFMGEGMIIVGTFFFSGEGSLLILLLISTAANLVAARGEEKDLKNRSREEYSRYLKDGNFILGPWSKSLGKYTNKKR